MNILGEGMIICFHVNLIWHSMCLDYPGSNEMRVIGSWNLWDGKHAKGFGIWFLEMLSCAYICQGSTGCVWGLLEVFYWWDGSCAPNFQIWQAGSLWACVTLEHERLWVVVICVVLFVGSIFLSFVICHKLRCAEINKDIFQFLAEAVILRGSRVLAGISLAGLLNPEDIVKILAVCTSRANTIGGQENVCLSPGLQDWTCGVCW